MAQWVAGKRVLVTGGGAGIGRALVTGFLSEGARVCALDRSPERLEALTADLPASPDLLTCVGDVTHYEDNERAVEQAVRAFGGLDAFIANAGIFDCFARLLDLSGEVLARALDEVFAVNVRGVFFGARAAAPYLQASHGTLIVTVSQAGFYPDGGGTIYTASKHALVGLIRELALELAPEVRVNGVAPGGTVTDLAGAPSLAEICRGRATGEARARAIRQRNPLRLAQTPEDHLGAYLLLASDRSRATTGTVLESDGGVGIRPLPRAAVETDG